MYAIVDEINIVTQLVGDNKPFKLDGIMYGRNWRTTLPQAEQDALRIKKIESDPEPTGYDDEEYEPVLIKLQVDSPFGKEEWDLKPLSTEEHNNVISRKEKDSDVPAIRMSDDTITVLLAAGVVTRADFDAVSTHTLEKYDNRIALRSRRR